MFLVGPVNEATANLIVAQMLFLESREPGQGHPLLHQFAGRLGLGGHGDLRHDAVHQAGRLDAVRRAWRPAWARSCWRPAPRASASALPNSRVMIHQPLGRLPGPGLRHRDPRQGDPVPASARLNEMMAQHTGQPIEQIERDTERDNFMGAEDAVKYGIDRQGLAEAAARE